MWRNFFNNLSKQQKIIGFIIIQLIFIIFIILTINSLINSKKPNVDLSDQQIKNIPSTEQDIFQEQLWNLLSSNKDLDTNIIKDATIRDDSYNEYTDSGYKTATFLIDINSLKLTYKVSISWGEDGEILPDSVLINCPPQSEMKYPETICQGMYNNTYSLDLYLPYAVYPEGNENLAPNYIIHGNEYTKKIDIMVSICNIDGYKQQALEYLNSTPIKLDEYQINYEVNNIDVEC